MFPTDTVFFTALSHFVARSTPATPDDQFLSSMPYFITHESAADLRTLALLEDRPNLLTDVSTYAPHMTKLERLVLAFPPDAPRELAFEVAGALPRSLRVLDISPQPFALALAEAVLRCYKEDRASVSLLQMLRLPDHRGRFSAYLLETQDPGEGFGQLKGTLVELSEVAEKRGAKVEWVEG